MFECKFFKVILQEIRLLSFDDTYEKKLFEGFEEPSNETHHGAVNFKIYQDIPILLCRMTATSSNRTFVDQQINLCKFFKHQRAFFVTSLFKNFYSKYYNPKLLECPIKKGFYHGVDARPRVKDLSEYVDTPSMVPSKAIFNLTSILRAKIGKGFKQIYSATWMVELL